MPEPGLTRALGIAFDPLDLAAACAACAARPADLPFAYVVTPHAVHVVETYRGEPMFLEGIDAAWLVLCDSRVVRNLVRLLFGTRLALAPGSDLTARLLEQVIGPDDPIAIIGGTPRVAELLRQRFGLRRVALYAPPFGFAHDPAEIAACVAFVRDHPARFVFLACGAPRSEMLGARIVASGQATGIGLCIGASLLFVTGQATRAPVAMQRMGLEWLHRLAMEPGRMARRLLTSQLPLLWVALRYRLRLPKILPDRVARAVPWHDGQGDAIHGRTPPRVTRL